MKAVPLGDLCAPKQWLALSRSEMVSDGYPVYGANGVIGYASRYTHLEPTVLIGCRGTIGAIHVSAPRAFVTSNAMALDSLDVQRVHQGYLARFLAWRGFKDVISGSSQPQLTRQNLVSVAVPMPPLEEQRRVAAVLDQADGIRASLRTALQVIDHSVVAWFDAIFGPGCSPLSAIGELGKVSTGRTPDTSVAGNFDGPIPFITPGDLGSRSGAKRSLTSEGARGSRVVRAGSTLVCCIGTIGKVDRAVVESAFNQQINAIEWNPELVDDAYGLEVMRRQKSAMAARASSTTMPLLSKGQFVKLEIPVPPLASQRIFARQLAVAEQLRDRVQRAIALHDELFASLQSRAFKGEL